MGSPELRAGRWAALLAGALAACSGGGADPGAPAARSELRVARKPVEDVFLLSGDLRAVRSATLNTPRGEGELQIRWMAEDGSEVKEGAASWSSTPPASSRRSRSGG